MTCVKCGTKMIPHGSPEERQKHRGYTIYGCPKCYNVTSIIWLKEVKI